MRLLSVALSLLGKIPLTIMFRFALDIFKSKYVLAVNRIKTKPYPKSFFPDQSIFHTDRYSEDMEVVFNRELVISEICDDDSLNNIYMVANKGCEHIFDMLGSGKAHISFHTKASGMLGFKYNMQPGSEEESLVKKQLATLLDSVELAAESESICFEKLIKTYFPIDWHLDFKSGYRFKPDQWYCLAKNGYIAPGVDIKVPWELSRFQHFGALALAYQDSKRSHYKEEFILQVSDWIVSNPYGFGVNWRCAMEVAIRVCNWLLAWQFFKKTPDVDGQFKKIFLTSINQHGRYIEGELEYLARGYHGNHYLSNIAGLIFIGALAPELKDSDRWLAFGIQELVNELKCQVYGDGVSFEGSAGYHCLAAELFYLSTAVVLALPGERRKRLLKYRNKGDRFRPKLLPYERQEFNLEEDLIFPKWYFERLEIMADFVSDLTKPDGNIPQFGDNDSGRFYRFIPALNDAGEERLLDHRNILALAGKLFGRKDFEEEGSHYQLDANIFFGNIDFLPVKSRENASVAKNRKTVGQVKTNGRHWQKSSFSISFTDLPGYSQTDKDISFYYYPEGGIAIYKSEHLYLAVSCSKNGLGGIGGHSHNDKLSFELNAGGKDFIVDGGSYLYTADPDQRNAFRSTKAHNTVILKGKEQNRIFADQLFLLPDRSKASVLEVNEKKFVGRHSGYGFNHTREFHFDRQRLAVVDYLGKACEACIVFNLHPDVEIDKSEAGRIMLTNKGVRIKLESDKIDSMKIEPGFYAKQYGKRVDNKRIVIPF